MWAARSGPAVTGQASRPCRSVDTVITPEGDVVQGLPVPQERVDPTLILDCGRTLPPFDCDPATTGRFVLSGDYDAPTTTR